MNGRIIFPPHLLRIITDAAEAAYPLESCGLLVGRGKQDLEIIDVVPALNVSDDPRSRFDIDPAVLFAVMRRLAGSDDRLVGHFHSHPDAPPVPSNTDRSMAYEAEFVWVITAVFGGQALLTAAHRIDAGRGQVVDVPLVLS